jgi:hypothetical protein
MMGAIKRDRGMVQVAHCCSTAADNRPPAMNFRQRKGSSGNGSSRQRPARFDSELSSSR